MKTPRELRLLIEFEAMKALRSPYALFDYSCADLTPKEGAAFAQHSIPTSVIEEGLSGFLPPEEFERRFPGRPPEKYLISYSCTGLERLKDGTFQERSKHLMEVVFGWRYPSERPSFIWLTNIWHPNFRTPYICLEGRPFAVGLPLTKIVQEVGRMIQYQNYNIHSPLNHDAAEWASQTTHQFPVDKRDILDGRREVGVPQTTKEELLVELIDQEMDGDQLIELIGPESE